MANLFSCYRYGDGVMVDNDPNRRFKQFVWRKEINLFIDTDFDGDCELLNTVVGIWYEAKGLAKSYI